MNICYNYFFNFEKRNKNLYVVASAIHADEPGAVHAHAIIVPYAEGYKNGPAIQQSLSRALENMDYEITGRKSMEYTKLPIKTRTEAWKEAERKELEKDIEMFGFAIYRKKNSKRELHLSVNAYRALMENRTAEKELLRDRLMQEALNITERTSIEKYRQILSEAMEVIAIYVEEQRANMGLEQILEEYGYHRTAEAKEHPIQIAEETANIIHDEDIIYMMDAYEEEKNKKSSIMDYDDEMSRDDDAEIIEM